MHILFITTAHNSLSQRLAVELGGRGHRISLCVGATADGMIEAAARHRPELILAPMLKTAIPEQVWRRHRCLIVHPGIVGDRGPSSLDWAISLGVDSWGVTVLQADAEMDAGPIWATETFRMPDAFDTLLPLVYEELRRLAARYMNGERRGHTLQATALVNEAYLRLIELREVRWQNRAHFFAMAARLMRRILVDAARSRDQQKRGGGAPQLGGRDRANQLLSRRCRASLG